MMCASLIASLLVGTPFMAPMDELPTKADEIPNGLEGVGVTEKIAATIAPELVFQTSDGQKVTWSEVLSGERPVLLTLNYSDCPMLCSLQLNGLVKALKEMPWVLGNEYDMVTVSLNTKEKPARAKETQTRYLKDYGKGVSPNAWKFLVGDDANVAALASAVGFGYKLDPQTGEYQHTAAVMVLTPEGKVSRYLYGVEYSPQTLRLSLAEASQGKFTSTLDQVVLYCFKYNATAGTYTPVVRNIMKIGAGVTVLLLGVLISSAWWLPKRRKLASAKA